MACRKCLPLRDSPNIFTIIRNHILEVAGKRVGLILDRVRLVVFSVYGNCSDYLGIRDFFFLKKEYHMGLL